MKLIKKAQTVTVNRLAKLNVGDKVRVQTVTHDGRNGSIVGIYNFTVLKINKVTFEGQDKEGNVYQIDSRDDNWKVVA
tara:strand:+ start:5963 stop:6196 length:234 start_codon:yes stop_codon:yes gene_type:complete